MLITPSKLRLKVEKYDYSNIYRFDYTGARQKGQTKTSELGLIVVQTDFKNFRARLYCGEK